jgi:preprotein translocase subunit SecE
VKSIINYISSVRSELAKVTWPKKEDVIKLTLIIFIISGIVAGYLGALDFALTKVFEAIIVN